MAAILGTIGTFLAGTAAVASVVDEGYREGARRDERAKQATEIEKQKKISLEKRKNLIDTERLQMGIGTDQYDTLKTSETGIDGTLQTLTGEVLG